MQTEINENTAIMSLDAAVKADACVKASVLDNGKLETHLDDAKRRKISTSIADADVNDKIKDKSQPMNRSRNKQRRRVSFRLGFEEAVHHIPDRSHFEEENLKEELFYSDADYERFKASEQRRYDKMVAKRLQAMVMEKMQPVINEAVGNGASLQDIEAMVPKTHEEMIEYMGGEETIRKLLEQNAFRKLKKEKTITSTRSSIAKNPLLSDSNETNEIQDTNTIEENEMEIPMDDKEVVEIVSPSGRKRTIRCTRSSIEISARNRGGILSEAESDAATASKELMAMIAEEEGETRGE